MRKRRLRAPSPPLVISLIALFVALGGTSYAAIALPKNSVGTKQLKNGAVTKTKISKKTLTQLKGNRGPAGPVGATGATGTTGATGATGPAGPAGTAKAYALVTDSATFIPALTKGFTAVTRPSTGIYCLTPAAGVDISSSPPIVSPEWNNSSGTDLNVAAAATFLFSGCTAGQVEIVTLSGSPRAFANNVAFTVLIP